jgi:hypothetical protein
LTDDLTTRDFNRGTDACLSLRFESQAGNRSDRRKRFSAKTERLDGEKVVGVIELARRMSHQTGRGIFGDHTFSVIGDADDAASAVFDIDGNLRGAGVERVFDQLLDDRSRAFDHLSCGNTVGDVIRKDADPRHRGAFYCDRG